MAKELTKATLKLVLPGLVVGGLIGAAIGNELVSQPAGIATAICFSILLGLRIRNVRKKIKKKLIVRHKPVGDMCSSHKSGGAKQQNTNQGLCSLDPGS